MGFFLSGSWISFNCPSLDLPSYLLLGSLVNLPPWIWYGFPPPWHLVTGVRRLPPLHLDPHLRPPPYQRMHLQIFHQGKETFFNFIPGSNLWLDEDHRYCGRTLISGFQGNKGKRRRWVQRNAGGAQNFSLTFVQPLFNFCLTFDPRSGEITIMLPYNNLPQHFPTQAIK